MRTKSTIEIDLDVYKKIEIERQNFAETHNDVLRRLLGIDSSARTQEFELPTAGSWTGKGVTLPAGTQIRMQYNGKWHYGEILDASWVVDGQIYKSPSAAAGGAARTKRGKRPSLDGWIYWEVKFPADETWKPLNHLRAG